MITHKLADHERNFVEMHKRLEGFQTLLSGIDKNHTGMSTKLAECDARLSVQESESQSYAAQHAALYERVAQLEDLQDSPAVGTRMDELLTNLQTVERDRSKDEKILETLTGQLANHLEAAASKEAQAAEDSAAVNARVDELSTNLQAFARSKVDVETLEALQHTLTSHWESFNSREANIANELASVGELTGKLMTKSQVLESSMSKDAEALEYLKSQLARHVETNALKEARMAEDSAAVGVRLGELSSKLLTFASDRSKDVEALESLQGRLADLSKNLARKEDTAALGERLDELSTLLRTLEGNRSEDTEAIEFLKGRVADHSETFALKEDSVEMAEHTDELTKIVENLSGDRVKDAELLESLQLTLASHADKFAHDEDTLQRLEAKLADHSNRILLVDDLHRSVSDLKMSLARCATDAAVGQVREDLMAQSWTQKTEVEAVGIAFSEAKAELRSVRAELMAELHARRKSEEDQVTRLESLEAEFRDYSKMQMASGRLMGEVRQEVEMQASQHARALQAMMEERLQVAGRLSSDRTEDFDAKLATTTTRLLQEIRELAATIAASRATINEELREERMAREQLSMAIGECPNRDLLDRLIGLEQVVLEQLLKKSGNSLVVSSSPAGETAVEKGAGMKDGNSWGVMGSWTNKLLDAFSNPKASAPGENGVAGDEIGHAKVDGGGLIAGGLQEQSPHRPNSDAGLAPQEVVGYYPGSPSIPRSSSAILVSSPGSPAPDPSTKLPYSAQAAEGQDLGIAASRFHWKPPPSAKVPATDAGLIASTSRSPN